jgi:carbamoyl-phosphate synthase large subunit
MVHELKLRQPPNTTASSEAEAVVQAATIGYPLVVRPSYVLGGRAMEIVYDESELNRYMRHAVRVSNESPVLLDRFLDDAIEVDIDAICDGRDVLIGGIMEHIEQAGVHSGDSACSLPPYTLSQSLQDRMREQMAMARSLGVVGLMNAQFAIKGDDIYILEVNPRAPRAPSPSSPRPSGCRWPRWRRAAWWASRSPSRGSPRSASPSTTSSRRRSSPSSSSPGWTRCSAPR